MTHVSRPTAQTTTSNRDGRRSEHASLQSDRRPNIRLISDGVVAGYIHDISQRHRDGVHAAEPRSRRPASHA